MCVGGCGSGSLGGTPMGTEGVSGGAGAGLLIRDQQGRSGTYKQHQLHVGTLRIGELIFSSLE